MHFKRATVVAVASWLMFLSLTELARADDRVVVFGDSWGVFTALSLRRTFDANAPGNDVLNAASGGEESSDLNTPGGLSDIASTLADHPSADLVHLSIGGNDIRDNWTASMPAAEEEALLTSITDNIEAIVSHIVAQDPNLEVFYSSYTYVRPRPEQGTPLEINTVMEDLQSRVEARLASIPRATTGNFYGLMQTLWGQSEFGLLPGDPSLPDINLPGPDEAFFDDIHLTVNLGFGSGPFGYDQLADAQYAAFYQSRLAPSPIYEADFDDDGDVDSDDLTHPTLGWEARYGNDLDGNDFLVWQRQLGSGVGAVSSLTTTVPEPSTGLLFCLGWLILHPRAIRRH